MIQHAVNRAGKQGLDEIGAMVRHHDWELQQALYEAGFQSLGDFRWLRAALPLPAVMPLSTSIKHPGRRREGPSGRL